MFVFYSFVRLCLRFFVDYFRVRRVCLNDRGTVTFILIKQVGRLNVIRRYSTIHMTRVMTRGPEDVTMCTFIYSI